MARSNSFTRAQLVALLLALPALVGAVGICALDARDLIWPPSPEYIEPAGSFADAIRKGDVEDAYAFVRAGVDPNTPIAFRDPDLTRDREVRLSPLLLAVAAHNENVVMMLLSFGARLDLPGNARALCLATRLGYRDLAEMIVRDGRPASDGRCPEVNGDASAPLLAFVE